MCVGFVEVGFPIFFVFVLFCWGDIIVFSCLSTAMVSAPIRYELGDLPEV